MRANLPGSSATVTRKPEGSLIVSTTLANVADRMIAAVRIRQVVSFCSTRTSQQETRVVDGEGLDGKKRQSHIPLMYAILHPHQGL